MKRLFLASLIVVSGAVGAQDWPTGRPIRLVVPFPPGGGVDFVSRTVAQRMGELLKITVVVDNRSGASGAIGADTVIKSTPDGYTMLIASPAEVLVGPISGQKVPYSAERDLAPVSLAGETPLGVAAHPSLPAKTLQDFIALARSAPGKYSYGTSGEGSTQHYAGVSLASIAKIDMQHVPYRGAAPAVIDLVGGQVPIGITGLPPMVPHVKSGKLRLLAVTSLHRSSTMPEVPAVAEIAGFAGYRFTNWMGAYLPAKTPQAVVNKLSTIIGQVVREPALKEKFLSQGVEGIGNTPAEFASFLRSERETYSKIAKERNIRVGD
jgi:tripartite-type tricarboxylate transporter receptor subunit TctC